MNHRLRHLRARGYCGVLVCALLVGFWSGFAQGQSDSRGPDGVPPTEGNAGDDDVTVRDLVEAYDYNTSLIYDLDVTFSYIYTPAQEYEEHKRKLFRHAKQALRYMVEQGHEPDFVDEDGNPMDLDSVSDEMWWKQMWPPLYDEQHPTRSHRWVQKGPVLRVWENGRIGEDGTYVTDYCRSFDGSRYATISPLDKRATLLGTTSFHDVEEPRKFLPKINYRPWPDFARPGATDAGPELIVQLPDGTRRPVPRAPVELKVAGLEVMEDHEVYKVTHTSFPNNLPGLFPGGLTRTVHTWHIDPDRGYQVVRWVSEWASRRTVEEDFAVTRKTIADQIELASDPAGQAWFMTHARIRKYTSDTRGRDEEFYRNMGVEVEPWPPKLVLEGTSELTTHDIQINAGIPDEAFTIEFPDGYMFYDQMTGVSKILGLAPADEAIMNAAALLRQAVQDAGPVPDRQPPGTECLVR